jgi:predicted RNA binding protein with dsRBD fold (UPF0201 family)
MDEITVRVDAEVNPTESEEKVKKAIENIFGNIPIVAKPLRKASILTAEAYGKEPLIKLYNLLRRERIRAAAKTVLLEGSDSKTISFCLNKQVAYAGHVSFAKEVAESPLGPIKVKIGCENPRGLVDWLTSITL